MRVLSFIAVSAQISIGFKIRHEMGVSSSSAKVRDFVQFFVKGCPEFDADPAGFTAPVQLTNVETFCKEPAANLDRKAKQDQKNKCLFGLIEFNKFLDSDDFKSNSSFASLHGLSPLHKV
jgi:hypothetical protein